MQFVVVIPARFASTRLPAKLLERIGGKTILEHTWQSVQNIDWVDKTIIATDHKRIADEVHHFGGQAIMTSENHQSGSDRIAEVVKNLSCDIIINVQGDEPFTSVSDLEILQDIFLKDSLHEVDVASLMTPIADTESIESPHIVKVVTNASMDALYFSRSAIPFQRSINQPTYYRHVGIYAYRKSALMRFVDLEQAPTEKAELLEQLRFLHHGMRIRLGITKHSGIAIDTAEDLEAARKYFADNLEQKL